MNKNHKFFFAAALLASLLLNTPQALASNITIRDSNAGNDAANELGFSGGPGFTSGKHSTSANNDREDNETESGFNGSSHVNTIGSQKWDLEGMSFQGSTLSLVGGFNFKDGQMDGNTLIRPGQLFIKVGGNAPGFSPLANTTATIKNVYGYNYAVDMITGKVYNLTANSDLYSTTYDFLGSNPWKYAGTDYDDSADVLFYSGLTPSGVVNKTGESSFSTLLGDAAVANDKHYVASVDLSDFMTLNSGDNIWFHYAEQCGNDSMRGLLHVPDAGSTLGLLGLGLFTLAIIRRQT
jgi:hypothetical protein